MARGEDEKNTPRRARHASSRRDSETKRCPRAPPAQRTYLEVLGLDRRRALLEGARLVAAPHVDLTAAGGESVRVRRVAS